MVHYNCNSNSSSGVCVCVCVAHRIVGGCGTASRIGAPIQMHRVDRCQAIWRWSVYANVAGLSTTLQYLTVTAVWAGERAPSQ